MSAEIKMELRPPYRGFTLHTTPEPTSGYGYCEGCGGVKWLTVVTLLQKETMWGFCAGCSR